MSTATLYECPFCSTQMKVSENLTGSVLKCPKCELPIEIEPGMAKPVPMEHDKEDNDADPIEEETIRIKKHPAMFRKHPLHYIGVVLLLILGITGVVIGIYYESWILSSISAIPALIGLGIYGIWWLKVIFATLTVTNKRTLYREGIISKETSEVLHRDVRNIQIDQNFWERLFGIGDIALSSSGQDDMEIVMEAISKPEAVASVIRENQ